MLIYLLNGSFLFAIFLWIVINKVIHQLYLDPCRVDISDQVQDILGGTHAKSASALLCSESIS